MARGDKKIQEVNFAINSYQARSGLMSSERLVNMYAELTPAQSPFKVALYGTPGLKIWLDFQNFDPVYGCIIMGGDLYIVIGLTVYKVDTNKNITNLGTLTTTPAKVMMTENGTQVTILTDSGKAFVATSSTLTEITDPDYKTSKSVTTSNGYTIFTEEESNQWFISDLNDSTSYNPLNFASAESQPDNLVRAFGYQNEVWLFGERTTEIWYNSGNPDFPFDRINGAFIDRGCAAKFSVGSNERAIYWLGDDRIVYRTQGYNPVRISTHPIEAEIESYPRIDDAFADFYTQEGHEFYCLTFPSANKTWCYDTTTRLWHERESRNPSTLMQEEWRVGCNVFFAGLNLVGDSKSGILYELDLDTYTENGEPIIREAISATQFRNFSETSFDRFVLIMDTGVGIDGEGQGDEPEIILQTSTDGGKIFDNELKQPLGAIGNYETEVYWTRVGYGRSIITKIKISDPIKIAIIGSYLLYEAGYI